MKYYVIDAFADAVFRGNPAGVCLLDDDITDSLMQSIASENNLAETAFVRPADDGYYLRWFTPDVEIDLCGHATLGSAFVLLDVLASPHGRVLFHTMSGDLTVTRRDGIYVMDFPSRAPAPVQRPPGLGTALGCDVLGCWQSRDLVVLVESEQVVRDLRPNIDMLKRINRDVSFATVVTAAGTDCDFVSRFFAPNAGVIEDPVTGSSHCSLIPFWRDRLGKTEMTARQLSRRGGVLHCRDLGERVEIGGTAVCYLKGELQIE